MKTPSTHISNKTSGFIRWKMLYFFGAIFLVSAIYLAFFFDHHLELSIEWMASNLNQAQVNIGSLQTHLFTGQIVMKGVEIADPKDPMVNVLQLDTIDFKVRLEPLLRKKLIVDYMNIVGVHYHTERKTSGSLGNDDFAERTTPSLMERVSTGFYSQLTANLGENPLKTLGTLLSGMDISDQVAQNKSELASIKSLAKVHQDLEHTENRWTSLLEEMPSADSILASQDQMKSLNRALATTPGSREILLALGQHLNQQKTQAATAWEKMTEDSKNIQLQLAKFPSYVEDDVHLLESRLKLPRLDFEDLSLQMFGPTLVNQLERATYWVDLSRRRMPMASHVGGITIVAQQRADGTSIDFAKNSAYPAFLLYHLSVHSQPSTADPSLGSVDGTLEGLTSDPAIYGRPLTFSLKVDFPFQNIRGLKVNGFIDHTLGEPNEHLEISAESLPITDFAINETGDVQLTMTSALLKFSGGLDFKGNDITGNLTEHFSDGHYHVSSRFKEIETVINTVITPINEFTLNAKLQGTPEKLNYLTNSEFGRHLATGLRDEFRHQIGAIEDDLRKNILDEAYPIHASLSDRYLELKERALVSAQARLKSLQDLLTLSDRELARLAANPQHNHIH